MVSTGLSTTGMISNTALISSLYDDPNTGNNAYTAHFDVSPLPKVDLQTSKSVSAAYAIPGEIISYSIDYQNDI
jgi:hypothetical protein